MFKNLEMFQASYAMARHSGARQAVTAANMANADTPGYRARTLGSFAESYSADMDSGLRTTRAQHLTSSALTGTSSVQISDAEAAPNGNSVSLEQEMVNSVEIQREHNRALAIYKHSLDVLRLSIGRK
ncbi:flagellar basal-body rod protein FlgB [Octadecabacter temperatus]|uniref:Flagellar basal body rod protein FlgB n=1 Tax=Octadecabacter temperatus TaxID=1458307 RepID=A0A0K0YA88_9RHOB|nr:FlgB family protein [Octadecabacter temperatus]AKS47807.1 flagellar basal body rod protein FlgB [Octadecabacter temperatus]SIO38213.1 flagellar basal-body rod protein FlgB [Octadecabacter temperatus]